MKWNLRMVAAQRDIWRPIQLLAAFKEIGFTPSLSKVAALWGSQPVTIRLDDLDKICAALECTVADLMTAQPDAYLKGREQESPRASAAGGGEARPVPRSGGGKRHTLPPN